VVGVRERRMVLPDAATVMRDAGIALPNSDFASTRQCSAFREGRERAWSRRRGDLSRVRVRWASVRVQVWATRLRIAAVRGYSRRSGCAGQRCAFAV